MRSLFSWIIATFVLGGPVTLGAAPAAPQPALTDGSGDAPPAADPQRLERFDVKVSQPPPATPDQTQVEFYPYKSALAPRWGYRIGLAPDADGERRSGPTLGFTYLMPGLKQPQWEIGFDLGSSNGGWLHVGRRSTREPTSYLRPFYKWGLLWALQSDQGLATLVDYRNIAVFGSLGVERFFWDPSSLRVEAKLILGIDNVSLHILTGYVWAW